MAIKIGDRVRFLNSIGGGIVKKFISKELVEIEDEDGFGIPTLISECVVVESETTIHTQEKRDEEKNHRLEKENLNQTLAKEISRSEEIIETEEGEKLNVCLGFVPIDAKSLSTTAYELYLINDSNYHLGYNIANGNGNIFYSRDAGFILPNTKELIEEISKEQLSDIEKLNVQIFALKQAKVYKIKPSYSVDIKLSIPKFFKLHCFKENDYFDENAMVIDVIKNDVGKGDEEIPADDLLRLFAKEDTIKQKKISHKQNIPEILEIDLHINKLLDNTNGMSNGDMLQYQLDKFEEVMKENIKRKGQKIVFIHGKGDGVLRKEILNKLKIKYPTCYHQDASFREYGFGATMVTIK